MIVTPAGTTPLPLFVVVLPFFVTFWSDTMWLLLDKIPVIDQTTQPKQWTKQVMQQSATNRCIFHDTVTHGYLLHSISSTIKALILLISHLHSNANELYGQLVHPIDDNMRQANPDDNCLNSASGPQVTASSSGSGKDDDDDDDEDDPWKRNNP